MACIKTVVPMEYLNENLSKFMSLSESSLEVSVHPERLINELFRGHCLEVECPLNDLIYTNTRRLFDVDAAPCTTAKQIQRKRLRSCRTSMRMGYKNFEFLFTYFRGKLCH